MRDCTGSMQSDIATWGQHQSAPGLAALTHRHCRCLACLLPCPGCLFRTSFRAAGSSGHAGGSIATADGYSGSARKCTKTCFVPFPAYSAVTTVAASRPVQIVGMNACQCEARWCMQRHIPIILALTILHSTGSPVSCLGFCMGFRSTLPSTIT